MKIAAAGMRATMPRLKKVSSSISCGLRVSPVPEGVDPVDAIATTATSTNTAATARRRGRLRRPLTSRASCSALRGSRGGRRGGGSSGAGRLLPVPVQRALDLHEPHDGRDDQEAERKEPEPCPAGNRRLFARALVHVPDLGRDDERAHGADEDPDHETEDAPQAFAGVPLHLVLGLVDPVPTVEAERDDEEQDPEADPARLPERAAWCCLSAHDPGFCDFRRTRAALRSAW